MTTGQEGLELYFHWSTRGDGSYESVTLSALSGLYQKKSPENFALEYIET